MENTIFYIKQCQSHCYVENKNQYQPQYEITNMAYNFFVGNCFHVNFLHQVVLVSLLCLTVITTLLTQHNYHTNRLLSYPNFIWDHCLLACDFHLTTSKCLTPIAVESVKFRDVSGRNRPKTRKRKCIQKSGVCVNKLLHSNFIWGLLLITSKGLTLIAVESVMFQDVSERKQPKHKSGGELIKNGGCAQEASSRTFQKGGELINYRMHSGIFLRKPLGGNHLHFVKKWHPRLP